MSKKSSKVSSVPDNRHWTDRSADDFVSRITFDFTTQVENALDAKDENQASLAKALGLTEGRVSQTLNNPASMSLKTIVKYARAIGRKVALVLYDDHDKDNESGPINSEIFSQCWEHVGKPRDMFELQTATTATTVILSSVASSLVSTLSSVPMIGSDWICSIGPHLSTERRTMLPGFLPQFASSTSGEPKRTMIN